MTISFRHGNPTRQLDIVRVPFVFTDLSGVKTRPALVVSSFNAFNRSSRHFLAAMITSAAYSSFPLDVPLLHPFEAGLLKPCLVRMKLMTLVDTLILEKIGVLHENDRQGVMASLQKLLPFHEH
ncbi:MAG: type II toxin-antitoxin system PemK/MazF family toxin [Pseudomonadota bacterium]|nr:type II toxin-antitoxin system PemK/MazF family toxin [Pseudomonadota bacterium]MDE3038810.1 type II toxin-antitoxin system PemK/MazF family toxin [Pseudomonadota bacterium]